MLVRLRSHARRINLDDLAILLAIADPVFVAAGARQTRRKGGHERRRMIESDT